MSRFFDDCPPYGRLITIPKNKPDYSVHELVEYDDEVIRIPIGRAWEREHTLIEVPGAIYELVPFNRKGNAYGSDSGPSSSPVSMAAELEGNNALVSTFIH